MKFPAGYVPGVGVVKASAYGGVGEKLLKSMGWADGQGLGKEGTGMKNAIEVKKKEDTTGVGAGSSSYKWEDKWWEKAYDSAVQTVGDSDAGTSSSDSEDDVVAPGHVAGTNRDGTKSSASAGELRLAARLSKAGRVAAGRFGGRDAKLERIRAHEARDAAEAGAKLGMPPPAAAPAAAAAGGSGRSDTTATGSAARRAEGAAVGSAGSPEALAGKTNKGKLNKKEKKALAAKEVAAPADLAPPAKKARIVIEPTKTACVIAADFVPTPATGWWGARRFASAGCLEGLTEKRQEAAAAQRAGRQQFNEGDQEKLYMEAHAGKTQGRVGLGQGTGTVKVGGVKWEGRKVTFEETPAGGGEQGADEAAARRALQAAAGSSTCLDQLAGEGAGAGWEARIKWRKVVLRLLGAAPGGKMHLAALRKLVAGEVACKLGVTGEAVGKRELRSALDSRLLASSKFVVNGKSVRLATAAPPR